MSGLDDTVAAIRAAAAIMDEFADKLHYVARQVPIMRANAARLQESIINIGPAAARYAGLSNSERLEAEVSEATIGEIDRASERLLAGVRALERALSEEAP